MASSTGASTFLQRFRDHDGWCSEDVALEEVEGMGVGMIATSTIKKGDPLFHIPANLILSEYTSSLHSEIADWDSLDQGWTRIILVMMWETSRGKKSPWWWYLESMPTEFSTPMFWSEEERAELRGTDIEDRIGREEAEELYHTVIDPVVKKYPSVFTGEYYTLDWFHIHGSRILSRSFTFPRPRPASTDPGEESDEEDDDDEAEEYVGMVPLADMLNAASGRNNARLYSSPERYTMSAEADIQPGDQIFNTYNEPPNSELLRKYGHIDLVPIPEYFADPTTLTLGNPNDEVQLSGERIVHLSGKEDTAARIEWWLDAGHDDTFTVSLRDGIEDDALKFAQLLLDDTVWAKAKKTDRISSSVPRSDPGVIDLLSRVLDDRLERYPTSLEDDLKAVETTTGRHRLAMIVRIGEKRCLTRAKNSHLGSASSAGRPSKKQKR